MMKAVYKLIITAILMVSVSLVHANGLTQMSLKEGIAGVSVTDFHEDKSGLMWIATSNGINLYDGINIQTYRLENTETRIPYLFIAYLSATAAMYMLPPTQAYLS